MCNDRDRLRRTGTRILRLSGGFNDVVLVGGGVRRAVLHVCLLLMLWGLGCVSSSFVFFFIFNFILLYVIVVLSEWFLRVEDFPSLCVI